jgi:hypothetical protein
MLVSSTGAAHACVCGHMVAADYLSQDMLVSKTGAAEGCSRPETEASSSTEARHPASFDSQHTYPVKHFLSYRPLKVADWVNSHARSLLYWAFQGSRL